jgi:hypothetical protein
MLRHRGRSVPEWGVYGTGVRAFSASRKIERCALSRGSVELR